jgi:transposase-like protein
MMYDKLRKLKTAEKDIAFKSSLVRIVFDQKNHSPTKGMKTMSGKIVQFDDAVIKAELSELVRQSVEETLNALLEEEATRLLNAESYERSDEREGYRAGHYTRGLTTKAGEVTLSMPKLKHISFQTVIIERYKRRESSVEEALVEMYLAGVSTRRVTDITEILWGTDVSASTVSRMNRDVYSKIDGWRNRRLEGKYPYVYVDGTIVKRNWGGEIENVSVLIAIGVNAEGFREIIGCELGFKEDAASWKEFFVSLKERGLKGTRLIIADKALGILSAVEEVLPEARYQRCVVHFYRNVFSKTPTRHRKQVAKMLKAIHAQESKEAALKKAESVIEQLECIKLKEAAKVVKDGIAETLTYMDKPFPFEHWVRIRTNNALERLNCEIKRRTKVVGAFPDGDSALMLVAARCRYVAKSQWGQRRYLDISRMEEIEKEEMALAS